MSFQKASLDEFMAIQVSYSQISQCLNLSSLKEERSSLQPWTRSAMFDWDEVPDDIANYVAVERSSESEGPDEGDEEEAEPKSCGYALDGVYLECSGCESALVPIDIEECSPRELETVRWMMQKLLLGQDMFLLSPPGALSRLQPEDKRLCRAFCIANCTNCLSALRRIVFRLCSLFGREALGFHGPSPPWQVEYVGITADTSEAGKRMNKMR